MNTSIPESETTYLLTKYSHGAGCGCKIAPAVLDTILHTGPAQAAYKDLLVGNAEKDDAAVFQISDTQAVVSTTDFFMPIVDDAFDFGQIASANAISDIYAMGGKPIMAIAILGWPVNLLPAELAGKVLEGARAICAKAGIPLAGGHSIDCPEPIFGLAVTGLVHPDKVKKNGGAKPGSKLYLTKPIGVGILSTAQKNGVLEPADSQIGPQNMLKLNSIGYEISNLEGIEAMTDVTGFGLAGHLIEMCEASEVSAELYFSQVPVLPQVDKYLDLKCIPGGTNRNWKSYGEKVAVQNESNRLLVADPQTSGGLLIAVNPKEAANFEAFMDNAQHFYACIGQLTGKTSAVVVVLD